MVVVKTGVEVFVVGWIGAIDPFFGMQELLANHKRRGSSIRHLSQTDRATSKGNSGVRPGSLIDAGWHLFRAQRIIGVQPRRTFAVLIPLLIAGVRSVIRLRRHRYLVVV